MEKATTNPTRARCKLVAGAALLLISAYSSATSDAQARLERYYEASASVAQSDMPERRKAAMIDAIFSSSFKEIGGSIPDEDLLPVFQATLSTLFYTVDKNKLPLMIKIFRRMAELKIAKSADYENMLQAYLAVRDFQGANAFLSRYHKRAQERRIISIDPLPAHAKQRTEWQVGEARRVIRRPVTMPDGTFLVVLASPHCHFATEAVVAMENDTALRPLLKNRIKLLAIQDLSFDYDAFIAWNRTHPSLPYALIHSRSEWPEVSSITLPTFAFYRDGKLLKEFSRWPEGGNMEQIYRGFGISYPTVAMGGRRQNSSDSE
ncbi:hypothetical protein [Massilia violaceinigra]|nr:hypothetical protein [Massilia violaceinigra]